MKYITVFLPPRMHQMTLDELLYGMQDAPVISNNETNTRTYEVNELSEHFLQGFSAGSLIRQLKAFNESTEYFRQCDRYTLYNVFYRKKKKDGGIPGVVRAIFKAQNRFVPCDYKKVYASIDSALRPLIAQHPAIRHEEIYQRSVGTVLQIARENGMSLTQDEFKTIFSSAYRKIDAPNENLKTALRQLKVMFESDFHAERFGVSFKTTYYHTSAFAYIRKRSIKNVLERHQANDSRWFVKYDLKNFFGNTTLDFTMHMLSMVYPFCEICNTEEGADELRKAVELGFLDGVLPQGTPLSPTLTNIIMVPIDYRLSNRLQRYRKQRFVYTRYADDMQISSHYDFQFKDIEDLITEVMREFNAPYKINTEKVHYGSRAGQNWMLGLMLNQNNDITVGSESKRRLKAALSAYIMDRRNGILWNAGDLYHTLGLYSYYRDIEAESMDRIVAYLNNKFGMDVIASIKHDLRPAG